MSGGFLAESLRLRGNVILRVQSTGKQAVGKITVLQDTHFDSTQGSLGVTVCSLIV